MITDEQIRANSSGELDPDTLRAMLHVIPAPAGNQVSGKGYQGTTATSLTGRHAVRLMNGIATRK
jgi:hypothetical protein